MFVMMGEPGNIFAPYQKLICRLPDWINRPLGSCYHCLCGQVSLWYFLFTQKFDFLELLFFISLSIFLTSIYSIIWNYE
jgi:hypothetical protein